LFKFLHLTAPPPGAKEGNLGAAVLLRRAEELRAGVGGKKADGVIGQAHWWNNPMSTPEKEEREGPAGKGI